MSTEVSDESCLTEDSSICNRTFELIDATFPSLTPVIGRKDSNRDGERLVSPVLDASGRTRAPINCEVSLEQLSLSVPGTSSSLKKAPPLKERRQVSGIQFLGSPPMTSSYSISTPDIVKGRASTLLKSVPPSSVVTVKGKSAFYRRKAYDEARRKSSLTIPRVDPRRRASITATTVAERGRIGAAALRTSKRAEARRQAMDKNRAGLHS